jgi:hypothetical protein
LKYQHVLVSYPRSGSNYFQLAWKEKNKESLECIRTSNRLEQIQEGKKIIGLIREPLDSISSRFLITETHENNYNLSKEVRVEYAVSEYIKIYEFLNKEAEFLVSILDFVKIDKVINTIYGKNSDPVNQEAIKDKLGRIGKYSTTFVEHENYQMARDLVQQYDLSVCKRLYKDLYQKRLMV